MKPLKKEEVRIQQQIGSSFHSPPTEFLSVRLSVRRCVSATVVVDATYTTQSYSYLRVLQIPAYSSPAPSVHPNLMQINQL